MLDFLVKNLRLTERILTLQRNHIDSLRGKLTAQKEIILQELLPIMLKDYLHLYLYFCIYRHQAEKHAFIHHCCGSWV